MQKQKIRGRQTSRLGVHIGISTLLLGVLLCAFFAAFSVALCKVDVPVNYITPLSTTGICAAVLLSALVLAMLEGQSGLLLGAMLGAGCELLLLAAAAFAGSEASFSLLTLYKALALLAFGAAGGYLGILVHERRRRLH